MAYASGAVGMFMFFEEDGMGFGRL